MIINNNDIIPYIVWFQNGYSLDVVICNEILPQITKMKSFVQIYIIKFCKDTKSVFFIANIIIGDIVDVDQHQILSSIHALHECQCRWYFKCIPIYWLLGQ